MSLDTANKRRTCIEVPGVSEYSAPDGTIASVDRAALSEIYAGISPTVDNFVFWRETGDSSSTWTGTNIPSFATSKTGSFSTNWVRVKELRDK